LALHRLGFIPDSEQFYFCHLDLYPRNMLVEIVDDCTLRLTGVLDWDAVYAHFCPRFTAFRAPMWIWNDDGADEWYEKQAAREPTEPDCVYLRVCLRNW
jgi:hypothetical protein